MSASLLSISLQFLKTGGKKKREKKKEKKKKKKRRRVCGTGKRTGCVRVGGCGLFVAPLRGSNRDLSIPKDLPSGDQPANRTPLPNILLLLTQTQGSKERGCRGWVVGVGGRGWGGGGGGQSRGGGWGGGTEGRG